MWRDAASVRIKLKVPATQRHHREHAARAHWPAISKVRFLYGLPEYNAEFGICVRFAFLILLCMFLPSCYD